jgi:hypothetical protein
MAAANARSGSYRLYREIGLAIVNRTSKRRVKAKLREERQSPRSRTRPGQWTSSMTSLRPDGNCECSPSLTRSRASWLPDGRFGRLVGLLSAVLIYAAACCPLRFFNAVLEYHPLRWIGIVSYGLYLWHWPLIRAAEDVPVGPLSRTILAFGATFVISAISFYWYEKPRRAEGSLRRS